jgi:hypothetical protein
MKNIVLIICGLTFTSCVGTKVVDMSTINQLSGVSAVTASQQVPVYDPDNGDARKASVTQLQTYMQANLDMRPDDRFIVMYPTVGIFGYAPVLTGSSNLYLIFTAITAQTVALSWFLDNNVVDGQEVMMSFAGDATVGFSVTPPTKVGWPPLITPPNITAGQFMHVRYDAATATWRRIG